MNGNFAIQMDVRMTRDPSLFSIYAHKRCLLHLSISKGCKIHVCIYIYASIWNPDTKNSSTTHMHFAHHHVTQV